MERGTFNKFWSPFLKLFKCFGVSNICNNSSSKPRRKTLISFIFHIINIASLVMITYTYTKEWAELTNGLNIFILIDRTLGLTIFATQIIVTVQSFMYAKYEYRIMDNFYALQCMLWRENDLTKLAPYYRRKYCYTIIVIIFIKVISTLALSNSASNNFELISYTCHVMNVRCFQVALYVDVLTDYTATLTPTINNREWLWMKKIFFKIVETKAMINNLFGLSLISIILQNILEMVNYAYWLIICYYNDPPNTYAAICKLLHNLRIIL